MIRISDGQHVLGDPPSLKISFGDRVTWWQRFRARVVYLARWSQKHLAKLRAKLCAKRVR